MKKTLILNGPKKGEAYNMSIFQKLFIGQLRVIAEANLARRTNPTVPYSIGGGGGITGTLLPSCCCGGQSGQYLPGQIPNLFLKAGSAFLRNPAISDCGVA